MENPNSMCQIMNTRTDVAELASQPSILSSTVYENLVKLNEATDRHYVDLNLSMRI